MQNLFFKIKEYSFVLAILTLPIYQTLNHWFFGLFMVSSFGLFFIDRNQVIQLKRQRLIIIVIGSFFLLKIMGLFTAIDLNFGIKELTRALPFLLYPICILTFKREGFNFVRFEKKVFYALSLGCAISAIICWTKVVLSLEPNSAPENMFFGWKKSGSFLTSILNIHPPYLGILLVASIIFLSRETIYNQKLSFKMKGSLIFICLFLIVFLFNITARNALFFLFLTSFIYIFYLRKWKLILIPIIAIIIGAIIVVNHPSQYYRIKMYDMLGLSKNDKFKDKRFSRLEGSINIFKEHPVIGAGGGYDQLLRNDYYKRTKDSIALDKQLNAHNQFIEYLAAHGLIGGLVFLIVNLLILFRLLKAKEYFYLILFINILVASLSESIFERVLGIQYYAILVALVILSLENRTKKFLKTV